MDKFKQWLAASPPRWNVAQLNKAIHQLVNASAEQIKNSSLHPYETNVFLISDSYDFKKALNISREGYDELVKAGIITVNTLGGEYLNTVMLQQVQNELKSKGYLG